MRDLAAVSSAAAIAVFGLCLRAAGLPLFPVALTLLAMMMSQTFWWRGVYWSGDVLRPAIGRTVGLIPEFTALGLCLVAVGAALLGLSVWAQPLMMRGRPMARIAVQWAFDRNGIKCLRVEQIMRADL